MLMVSRCGATDWALAEGGESHAVVNAAAKAMCFGLIEKPFVAGLRADGVRVSAGVGLDSIVPRLGRVFDEFLGGLLMCVVGVLVRRAVDVGGSKRSPPRSRDIAFGFELQ